jgi:hypothetical protein
MPKEQIALRKRGYYPFIRRLEQHLKAKKSAAFDNENDNVSDCETASVSDSATDTDSEPVSDSESSSNCEFVSDVPVEPANVEPVIVVKAIVEDDLQKQIEADTYKSMCRAELDYLNPD